jgi:DNA-binding NarL/FixJ family response regulator
VSQTLTTAVTEALASAEHPLFAAASLVRSAFEVDRVSVARVDTDSARFEIAESAGADLLAAGTTLPVSTCSYFAEVADDRTFLEEDFDHSASFSRPLDGVVLAAGFHSGCSVPIRHGCRPVGAISLSSATHRPDMTDAARRLAEVSPALGLAMERLRPPSAPSVLVCGSDPLALGGIARMAEQTLGARTEVATTLAAALATAQSFAPEVIVCEDRIEGLHVDAVAEALRAAGATAPLLVLATHDTTEDVRAALRAGAAAYVARRDAVTSLPGALCEVRGGRKLLPAEPGADEQLTARELELLEALDEGLRFKQVAGRLGIAEATAKTHGRNLFRKLGASSRSEAVRAARDRGLLT